MRDSVADFKQSKYEQADIELRLKLFDFTQKTEIQSQIAEAFYIWNNNAELMIEDIVERDIDDIEFGKFFEWFIHDFKLFDSQKGIIELFIEEQGKNISEIEEYIINDWKDNLYSFFEVGDSQNTDLFLIKDIFTGETYQVKNQHSDYRLTASDIISARLLKTGNFLYLQRFVSIYPRAIKPLILDYFNRELAEFRKRFGRNQPVREYLRSWGFLIQNYVDDFVKQPKYLTPEGDELVFGRSVFRVDNYNKVLIRLRKLNFIKEIRGGTDELRVFYIYRNGNDNLSGTIELEKEKLTLQSYSINLLTRAKRILEKKLSPDIIFVEDLYKDYESSLEHSSLPKTKKSLRNQKNNVRSKSIQKDIEEYYDKWIDQPIEALGGKTPNQCLQSTDDRERLNSVLNELEEIYKNAKIRGELYYDINKLREKLKLK